ncbi:MAG: DUF2167 domain-containing protein [Myxococcota bacterium]
MKLLTTACFIALAFISVAAAKPPQTEEERTAALRALTWRDGKTLALPLSHATLQAPEGISQLLGKDAATLWEALNGVDAPSGMEASLYDPKTEALVFFQKLGDGYVKLDDWEDVDADAMLKSVSENTEADNARRKATGLAGLHVVGWRERPHLDRAANTVRWSFEARDDESGELVNSIALVLARDGFEKLIWVGAKKDAGGNDLLKVAQASFAFPVGGRYGDFQAGDKVAEYGIAGLVASVLGAKVAAKLGLFALIAVFAKKIGVFLLVPLFAIVAWVKRRFARNKPT